MEPSTDSKTPNRRKARAKRLLKSLVEFINVGGNDDYSRAMWAILTALRGPDDGNPGLKYQTTARLRYTIGLGPHNGFDVSKEPLVLPGDVVLIGSDHFRAHYSMAYNSLKRLGIIKPD